MGVQEEIGQRKKRILHDYSKTRADIPRRISSSDESIRSRQSRTSQEESSEEFKGHESADFSLASAEDVAFAVKQALKSPRKVSSKDRNRFDSKTGHASFSDLFDVVAPDNPASILRRKSYESAEINSVISSPKSLSEEMAYQTKTPKSAPGSSKVSKLELALREIPNLDHTKEQNENKGREKRTIRVKVSKRRSQNAPPSPNSPSKEKVGLGQGVEKAESPRLTRRSAVRSPHIPDRRDRSKSRSNKSRSERSRSSSTHRSKSDGDTILQRMQLELQRSANLELDSDSGSDGDSDAGGSRQAPRRSKSDGNGLLALQAELRRPNALSSHKSLSGKCLTPKSP